MFKTSIFKDEQDKFDYFDYLSEVTYLNLKHYADKMNGIYFEPINITNKTGIIGFACFKCASYKFHGRKLL